MFHWELEIGNWKFFMSSPYQDFVKKAKERFEAKRQAKANSTGQYRFTMHSQYKMQQYGLSEQKVRSVIRNPRRREEGIVKDTVAVMQPVSVKRGADGKDVWKQEIWVMFTLRKSEAISNFPASPAGRQFPVSNKNLNSVNRQIRIISAWRYPGVSPKRNPIPEDILREIEEGDIMEIGE
jgi:hypothetical protein